jgi:hypothetical protein
MAESPFEVLTEHPLTETTRKERRSLLAVSSISIAMMWTGMFPTQIGALGLSFPSNNRQILIHLLGLINAYLFGTFTASALTDFANWRHRFRAEGALWLQNNPEQGNELTAQMIDHVLRQVPLRLEAETQAQQALLTEYLETKSEGFWFIAYRLAPSAVVKAALDFVLPIILGLWAVCVLLPWSWIAWAAAAAYVIGVPLAYRTSKLEVVRPRAVALALRSWFYIVLRRWKMRDHESA